MFFSLHAGTLGLVWAPKQIPEASKPAQKPALALGVSLQRTITSDVYAYVFLFR